MIQQQSKNLSGYLVNKIRDLREEKIQCRLLIEPARSAATKEYTVLKKDMPLLNVINQKID
ncbi:hypothetical protein A8L45_03530 [Veronia pacifica]|uniref:Uncharacterized protein n=1 Tax=Veronia pacifica TaxID=1080227 RepID=A0A1C3ER20_9GAMM|nr:hypothetical protein A8L45_03530 [Veronia pacifica]